MATYVEIPYWQAEDGTLWPTEEKARRHEAKKELTKILSESLLWEYSTAPDAEEVAEWMIESGWTLVKEPS